MQLYGLVRRVPSETEASGNKCIPLQKVDVDVQILDMIAEVTLSQTYNNLSDDTIEAVYKFPMPANAAINNFEVEFPDGHKIIGKIEEKKKAQQTYNENLEQGHGTYLFEEVLPDIFEIEVGNISPRQVLTIHIRYVQELANDTQDDDQVRFFLPTTIAPRYESAHYYGGPDVNKNINYSPSGAKYTLSVNVNARMSGQVLKLESPSHPITFEIDAGEGGKVVKSSLAQKETYLDKDYVLLIKSKALDSPRAFVEFNKDTNTHTVMLTLVPRFELAPVRSELVFIVDRSGSMMGDKIVKTKEALSFFIRSLPEDSFFNIISFGSGYNKLFENSMPYSQDTFSKAIELVDSLQADMGGTEIYQPLEAALENARSDMYTTIILLTDGEVSQEDAVVQLVRKHSWENKKDAKLTRVFALGIGDAVSHYLVDGVARVGRGYSQYISENERLEKKVMGMLKNAIQPPVNYQKIKWVNEEATNTTTASVSEEPNKILSFFDASKSVNDNTSSTHPLPSIRQTPHIIPVILPHSRLIVYAILAQAPRESILLSGVTSQGPIKLDILLEPATEGTKLHTLAARKMIMELQEGTSYVHLDAQGAPIQIPNRDMLANTEILDLGLKFSLVSSRTSFIAIDRREGVEGTISRRVVIPTLNPEFRKNPYSLNLMSSPAPLTSRYRRVDSHTSSTYSPTSSTYSPTSLPLTLGRSAAFSSTQSPQYPPAPQIYYQPTPPPMYYQASFTESLPAESFSASSQIMYAQSASSSFHTQQQQQQQQLPVMGSYSGYGSNHFSQVPQMALMSSGSAFGVGALNVSEELSQQQQQESDLSRLIRLSEFGGFFKLSEELAHFFKFGSAKDMAEKKPHGVSGFEKDDIWATVFVIAFLSAKMSEFSEVWESVGEKARVWVTKQGITDVDILVEKAKQVVLTL